MRGYIVLAAVMLAVCAIVCTLLCHHIQKKMEVTYQNLLQRLDRSIGGEIQDTAYDESMDTAVMLPSIRLFTFSQTSAADFIGPVPLKW